jgi:hypothetical protein
MNSTNLTDNREFVLKISTILDQLVFYACIVGIDISVLGNIINILIFLRKSIRKEIISFYNIMISIWNILTLLLGFIAYFPASIHTQDFLLKSDFACATISFLLRVCTHMASWLYVCLTIDKYLCVAFNNKLAYIFNDRKKLSFIILGLLSVICLINVPNFFFRLSLNTKSDLECMSTPLLFAIRNLTTIFFRTVLPISLQIVFSCLLLHKLFKVRRSVVTNHSSMIKEYKFARIILWLNLIFIITETPFLLMTVYISVFNVMPVARLNADSSRDLAITMVIYYATLICSMYMFGSLFFVNLFTNNLFRKEIRKMFGLRKSRVDSDCSRKITTTKK